MPVERTMAHAFDPVQPKEFTIQYTGLSVGSCTLQVGNTIPSQHKCGLMVLL
jgi:hypothetical protein